MYQASKAKKLVLILATFISMTGAKETQEVILDWVPYIYFALQFRKNKKPTIQALIHSSSKVNIIN